MSLLRKNTVAHVLVAETCQELAHQIFENYARDNKFYASIKEIDDYIERQEMVTDLSGKQLFIRALASQLRPVAIRILSHQLEDPTLDESYKQEIFDAIMLDKCIPERANLN